MEQQKYYRDVLKRHALSKGNAWVYAAVMFGAIASHSASYATTNATRTR
jgi:hypothetical protein